MYKICERIIKKHKLFWQYPVISEKTVYEQQRDNKSYIGIPWATIIDKRINIINILKDLVKEIDKSKEYITFCQHIHFRRIIPILHYLNIKRLYTCHKIIGEDIINKIEIRPAPLYAVNTEDSTRNMMFIKLLKTDMEEKCKILNKNKNIKYSFIGNYKRGVYLTNIRERILRIKNRKDTFIRPINGWHFNDLVYTKQVKGINLNINHKKKHDNNTKLYNMVLIRSRYSLCPSGSGPNSIRLWESLALGSIPILLADTLELPKHELWDKAIIKLKERDLNKLDDIINKITEEEEKELRLNCLKIYDYFKNNFLQF